MLFTFYLAIIVLGAKLRNATKKLRTNVGKSIATVIQDPSALTISSIIFASLFVIAHAFDHALAALIFMVLAYLIDTVDGAVARALGKASKWGNYLDAMVDKYVEAIIYIGLGMTAPFPALLAALGSLIESYAKPRTAMVIPIDNHDWPAIGERVERCAIIALGYGIYALTHQSDTVLNATLYAVAIMTWIGSVQRVFYAKRIIEQTQ